MDPRSPRAAVGSDFAKNLIKRKAAQLSRQRGFVPYEAEDLESDLILRLLDTLDKYDSERGHVHAFIKTVVESAAAMIARERACIKRGSGIRPASVDQPSSAQDDQAPSLGNQLTSLDLGRRLGLLPSTPIPTGGLETAIAALPPHLQATCRELMAGTISSAARAQGVSRRQVRKHIEEIRARFREAGLEDLIA